MGAPVGVDFVVCFVDLFCLSSLYFACQEISFVYSLISHRCPFFAFDLVSDLNYCLRNLLIDNSNQQYQWVETRKRKPPLLASMALGLIAHFIEGPNSAKTESPLACFKTTRIVVRILCTSIGLVMWTLRPTCSRESFSRVEGFPQRAHGLP